MADEFRGILRVAGADLNGKLVIARALLKIRGIGLNLADNIAIAFEKETKLPKTTRVGDLTDSQVTSLEAIIKNPGAHGIPHWQLCDRKDKTTGADSHMTGADLEFKKRQDIEAKKKLRTYHGIRHMYGLPVWGGCTRTRARGGTTLGVIRKKEAPAKAGDKSAKPDKKK